jgi:hypothetical protein
VGPLGAPPPSLLVAGKEGGLEAVPRQRRNAKPPSRVYQAVCSPLRNPLPGKKSRLQSVAWSATAALAARLLSRLAGVEGEDLTRRLTHDGPFFDNQVATLELDGPEATITFEGAVLDASGEPRLRRIYSRRLA